MTTASRLDISRLAAWGDGQSNVSVSEYPASTWQPGKEVLGFPPPPACPDGAKAFECPYCFRAVPERAVGREGMEVGQSPYLIRRRRTYRIVSRAHLIHTTCGRTSARTSSAERQTSSTTAWQTGYSMRSPPIDMVPPSFSSPQLGTEHPAEGSSAGGPEVRCIFCPVCLAMFATFAELGSHLARHLERFALFALPRSVGQDADSDHPSRRARTGDSREGGFSEDLSSFSISTLATTVASAIHDESNNDDMARNVTPNEQNSRATPYVRFTPSVIGSASSTGSSPLRRIKPRLGTRARPPKIDQAVSQSDRLEKAFIFQLRS